VSRGADIAAVELRGVATQEEAGLAEGIPPEGLAEGIPAERLGEDIPEEGFGEGMPVERLAVGIRVEEPVEGIQAVVVSRGEGIPVAAHHAGDIRAAVALVGVVMRVVAAADIRAEAGMRVAAVEAARAAVAADMPAPVAAAPAVGVAAIRAPRIIDVFYCTSTCTVVVLPVRR
jgi:hypothetical protein